MPPQNQNDESEEIDVTEILQRIETLEKENLSKTKEIETIKGIGSRLESIERQIKDLDESIDFIADQIGNG